MEGILSDLRFQAEVLQPNPLLEQLSALFCRFEFVPLFDDHICKQHIASSLARYLALLL